MPVKRQGKLSGLAAKLENAQKRALIESGMVIAQRATGKAPRVTGRLKRSITHGEPEQIGPGRMKIDIGTNVEYARIKEFGGTTGPHVITPVNKKALAFEWPAGPAHLKKKGTDIVILKRVMHPGSNIPAKPYLRPAIQESRDVVKAIHIKNITAAFK